MRKDVVYYVLSFLLGIYCFTILETFFPLYFFVLFIIAIVLCKKLPTISLILISFGVGFLFSSYKFNHLDMDMGKANLNLVITDKKNGKYQNSYFAYPKESRSTKLLFKSYNDYEIADEVYLIGDISLVRKNSHPSLFNLRNHYIARNIKYQVNEIKNITVSECNDLFLHMKRKFHFYIRDLFEKNLSEKQASFCKSLILGDKFEYDSQLRSLNLTHLLVVSGLHMDMLFTTMVFFLLLMGFDRKLCHLFSLFICLIYAYFIGFPFSILRLLIINFLALLAFVSKNRRNRIKEIAISAFIISLIYPFCILSLSFIMSFSAVIAIRLGYIPFINRMKLKSPIAKSATFVLIIQIFMFFISTYYFNEFNLLQIPANLLIVPVFVLLFYMLFFTIIFYPFLLFLKKFVFFIIAFMLETIFNMSNLLYAFSINIKFYTVNMRYFPIVAFVLLIVIFNMKKQYRRYNKMFLQVFILLLVLSILSRKTLGRSMEIISLRNGEYILVKNNENILFDIEDEKSNEFEHKSLVKILKSSNIKQIDSYFILKNKNPEKLKEIKTHCYLKNIYDFSDFYRDKTLPVNNLHYKNMNIIFNRTNKTYDIIIVEKKNKILITENENYHKNFNLQYIINRDEEKSHVLKDGRKFYTNDFLSLMYYLDSTEEIRLHNKGRFFR